MASQELTSREPTEMQEHQERFITVSPRTDIFESADEYLVIAEIPGARPDDLEIQVDAERLTIEARMELTRSGTEVEQEFRPMRYRRSFAVPPEIDRSKVSADCRNGVLWLHLPKSEHIKPRRIPVRGSA